MGQGGLRVPCVPGVLMLGELGLSWAIFTPICSVWLPPGTESSLCPFEPVRYHTDTRTWQSVTAVEKRHRVQNQQIHRGKGNCQNRLSYYPYSWSSNALGMGRLQGLPQGRGLSVLWFSVLESQVKLQDHGGALWVSS